MLIGALSGRSDPLQPLAGLGQGGKASEGRHVDFTRIKTVADLEREVAGASAAGRPVMLDFYADWCVACKELERHTFSDPRVIELAKSFVTVRVDATERTPEIRSLEKAYGIVGLPWVVFVSPEGALLRDLTVIGFTEADAMLERMRRGR